MHLYWYWYILRLVQKLKFDEKMLSVITTNIFQTVFLSVFKYFIVVTMHLNLFLSWNFSYSINIIYKFLIIFYGCFKFFWHYLWTLNFAFPVSENLKKSSLYWWLTNDIFDRSVTHEFGGMVTFPTSMSSKSSS